MPDASEPSDLTILTQAEAAAPEAARRPWVRPALLLALFGLVIVLARLTDLTDHLSAAGLRGWARALGPWAPAAVLMLYLIRPLVLFPITPLWIGSGALFGWPAGALWAALGTCLGAAVGFGLARHLGRDFVERRFGRRTRGWVSFPREEATRSVLALQLTPIMPHDLINNLAGVSRMSYRSFLIGSFLGTVPVILIYSYVGYAVLEIPSPRFWVAVGLLTAMTIAMLAWNRRRARRRAEPSNPGGEDAKANARDGDGDGAPGRHPGLQPGPGR